MKPSNRLLVLLAFAWAQLVLVPLGGLGRCGVLGLLGEPCCCASEARPAEKSTPSCCSMQHDEEPSLPAPAVAEERCDCAASAELPEALGLEGVAQPGLAPPVLIFEPLVDSRVTSTPPRTRRVAHPPRGAPPPSRLQVYRQ